MKWTKAHAYLLEHDTIDAKTTGELLGINQYRAGSCLADWHAKGRVIRVSRGVYRLNHAWQPKLPAVRRVQLALEARGELTAKEAQYYAEVGYTRALNSLQELSETGRARKVGRGLYAAV